MKAMKVPEQVLCMMGLSLSQNRRPPDDIVPNTVAAQIEHFHCSIGHQFLGNLLPIFFDQKQILLS
jgi:hypothetical protein